MYKFNIIDKNNIYFIDKNNIYPPLPHCTLIPTLAKISFPPSNFHFPRLRRSDTTPNPKA